MLRLPDIVSIASGLIAVSGASIVYFSKPLIQERRIGVLEETMKSLDQDLNDLNVMRNDIIWIKSSLNRIENKLEHQN